MFKIFKKNTILIIIIMAAITVFSFANHPRDAISQFGSVGSNTWYLLDNDFEDLTVGTSTAVGFGNIKTTHPESARVRFRVEDNDIHVRTDGPAPTISVGELVKAGEPYQVVGYENIVNFKVIAISGTAKLPSHYAVMKAMK